MEHQPAMRTFHDQAFKSLTCPLPVIPRVLQFFFIKDDLGQVTIKTTFKLQGEGGQHTPIYKLFEYKRLDGVRC